MVPSADAIVANKHGVMTVTAVQFDTVADYALSLEERLVELVDVLVELGQRLDTLKPSQ